MWTNHVEAERQDTQEEKKVFCARETLICQHQCGKKDTIYAVNSWWMKWYKLCNTDNMENSAENKSTNHPNSASRWRLRSHCLPGIITILHSDCVIRWEAHKCPNFAAGWWVTMSRECLSWFPAISNYYIFHRECALFVSSKSSPSSISPTTDDRHTNAIRRGWLTPYWAAVCYLIKMIDYWSFPFPPSTTLFFSLCTQQCFLWNSILAPNIPTFVQL